MQEKLIIYLPPDLANPSWAVVDKLGQIHKSASHDMPSGLSDIAQNKEVIVLVPAQAILLTHVQLPKLSRARLIQAIPYALEDSVTENIEELHFAFISDPKTESTPVAIVAHEKMQSWLALLNSWHIKPAVLTSSIFALPEPEESTWQIVLTEAEVWLRTNQFNGFSSNPINFPFLFELAQVQNKPLTIHIKNYGSQSLAFKFPSDIAVKETSAEADQMIEDFARNITNNHLFLNLLQQTYAQKKSMQAIPVLIKKIALYSMALWIFLLFLSPIISYFILKPKEEILQKQIVKIYQSHFPHSKAIGNPRQRLEEKLKHLSQTTGNDHFLLLLSDIGKALHAQPNVKLQRLDLQNNQLTLAVRASSSDTFSAFTDVLSAQGHVVKQSSATLVDEKIDAVLTVE